MVENNYNILIQKLDEFIRKYYKNQLIRGCIYFFTVSFLFYLILAITEYFSHFEVFIRSIIFFSFIFINTIIIGKLLVIPLLNLFRIGKIISHKQASIIIGSHFSEVQDKLINILQLHELADNTSIQRDLIDASINQKIIELKPIKFTLAIDFKKNKKYLKHASIPVFIALIILFTAPSIIRNGTKRLISYNKQFEEEAPFRFQILNKSLETVQQKDFQLEVKILGEQIPENIFIEIGENQYKLEKENTILFHYIFKNLNKGISFKLIGDGYQSKEYELKVLPNPIVLNFQVYLNYPKYLNKKPEILNNTGDLLIPEGTKVTWKFLTKDTKILKIQFKDSLINVKSSDDSRFEYTRQMFNNLNYKISTSNKFVNNSDSITYIVNAIPDAFPTILVDEFKDTISAKKLYYKGIIKDDYGFYKLTFNYKYIKRQDSLNSANPSNLISKNIIINNENNQQEFYYYWDLNNINLLPGDEIEYYFEVFDNDGIHGSKSSRSQKLIYKVPTLEEITKQTSNNNEKIKQELEASIGQAKKLKNEIDKLKIDLIQKKNLIWDDKKKIKDILNKQSDLKNKVENLQKENKSNNQQESEFKKQDEKILEKQKKLEELFKNVMTDEMKKLFDELREMLDKVDKNQVQQMLEKMQLSSKDLEKELDRNLDLFKQLEVEQKLQQAIDNLKDQQKRQDNLSKESDSKNIDSKKIEEKQNELNKDFQEFKNDLKELEKKNQELQEPNKMENTENKQNEIEKEQKEASSQLQNNKSKKASQSQKKAAEKMDELSQKMEKMQQKLEEEKEGEDEESLRQILENLLKVSFAQEDLMNKLNKTNINDPQYPKISQDEQKLKDNSKMIEDSLFALSKRQVQLQSYVNLEISAINMNIDKAIGYLEERNTPMAANRQQFAMTSVNNLALILSESLQQMKAKASSKKSNSSCKKGGQCKSPGQGKPSASSMKKMQEEISKQIQKLKGELEKQGKEGGKKQFGEKGGISEKIAKLAAQQEALKQELQKFSQGLKNDPKGNTGSLDKVVKQMDENETDLVNKIITNETLKRQQEILTRLLDAEKAERERDEEEKRESKENKFENYSNHFDFLKYNNIKKNESEILKNVPPNLNPFYKNKVNEYFNNFGAK